MDIREVKAEINRLEGSETNYQNCNRLAVLYIIEEHLGGQPETVITPKEAEYSIPKSSEFLEVVSRAPLSGVLSVMDEHMECIKALYPKEYSVIINKIMEL